MLYIEHAYTSCSGSFWNLPGEDYEVIATSALRCIALIFYVLVSWRYTFFPFAVLKKSTQRAQVYEIKIFSVISLPI